VPTYKDQQEKLSSKDLSTYGFLGYPLLMSSDILIYRANLVPVGEDQIPHIEFTRELARRFNHMYGREPGFEDKARAAVKKLGSKKARLYEECRTAYQEKGDEEALESAKALLNDAQNLSMNDRERLFGYLEGSGKMILAEPEALLTEASKMPGLDGQKMSKSYNNTIALREDPDTVAKQIRTMPTDPARVRRTDPGNPANCPVWQFHQVYSDDGVRQWVTAGCTTAGIGCIECKQPVIDAVLAELAPIRERAKYYEDNPDQVRNILADGCEKAQEMARDTMRDVRESMGLTFGLYPAGNPRLSGRAGAWGKCPGRRLFSFTGAGQARGRLRFPVPRGGIRRPGVARLAPRVRAQTSRKRPRFPRFTRSGAAPNAPGQSRLKGPGISP
jgi:tryptophanyl-tRNA synthetase